MSYKHHKKTALPAKYEAGFLDQLDRRSQVYKALRESYETVADEAGGEDNLSRIQQSLIERFVFLEACLQAWENTIATDPKNAERLLSRWIQGLNSLQGLAKTIGLKRQPKKVANLRAYVEGRDE